MEMTKRERLVAALHSKEVDRLPWSPLIDDYFINSLPLQNLDYNILEATRAIGCDFMERHVASPNSAMSNVTIRQENKNNNTIFYYDTPIGSISQESRKAGKTSFVIKNFITSIEDAKVYKYIAENTYYTPNIRKFVARNQLIGDDGMATVSGKFSPIQELLQYIAGVENTVYLMLDHPNEMDDLFNTMHERNKRYYRILCEYPCCVVFDYEDTSTTVMSKDMFVKYSQPYINEYTDILHGSGKLLITHMCGKLTGFVDEIAKGKQDGIDSLCPPETGDLYPWDARRIWGKSKVIIGGIDPPEFSRITEEQTLRIVIEIMKKLDNKLGFILSSGDAVAYGTPFGNLTIITRLIEYLGSKSLTTDFDDTNTQELIDIVLAKSK